MVSSEEERSLLKKASFLSRMRVPTDGQCRPIRYWSDVWIVEVSVGLFHYILFAHAQFRHCSFARFALNGPALRRGRPIITFLVALYYCARTTKQRALALKKLVEQV